MPWKGNCCYRARIYGPVTTVCEMCEGKRYSEEALSYEYRGHNIADIMELTVEDALEFFNDKPKISENCAPCTR